VKRRLFQFFIALFCSICGTYIMFLFSSIFPWSFSPDRFPYTYFDNPRFDVCLLFCFLYAPVPLLILLRNNPRPYMWFCIWVGSFLFLKYSINVLFPLDYHIWLLGRSLLNSDMIASVFVSTLYDQLLIIAGLIMAHGYCKKMQTINNGTSSVSL